jgi:hypothetical protein
MHDMSAPAAHHHAPPTSFIRKYVFSLDHKVIGKQYYALALVAALCGMVLSWMMRIHLLDECRNPRPAIAFEEWCSRRGDDARVLSAS